MARDEPRRNYRANTRKEHVKAWKWPWCAWTIGLPSWIFQKAAEYYDRTKFAGALQAFEPLGISIALLGFLIAVVALGISLEEFRISVEELREGRGMRKAALVGLLYERLEEASSKDEGRIAACKRSRVGQMTILEEIVRQGVDLRTVTVRDVNLAFFEDNPPPGGFVGISLNNGKFEGAKFFDTNLKWAEFRDAELYGAEFRNSHLLFANFTNADLRHVFFWDVDLRHARFVNADLDRVVFRDTNIGGADFAGAKNLSKGQFKWACATVTPPQNLPWSKEIPACANEARWQDC